jgi:hypothetical protein|tara:strand:- start:90 stop:548 length:459 start_codon:yes stop_codon:yes gene_type:complete
VILVKPLLLQLQLGHRHQAMVELLVLMLVVVVGVEKVLAKMGGLVELVVPLGQAEVAADILIIVLVALVVQAVSVLQISMFYHPFLLMLECREAKAEAEAEVVAGGVVVEPVVEVERMALMFLRQVWAMVLVVMELLVVLAVMLVEQVEQVE